MFELFGIGKAGQGRSARPTRCRSADGGVADSPISALRAQDELGVARNIGCGARATASRRVRCPARRVRRVLPRDERRFTRRQPSGSRSAAAAVNGMSARVDPFDVDYDVLQSTDEVNTQTAATTRESTSAIGLDVTSPESASRLTSSASLGLDVTGAVSTRISKAGDEYAARSRPRYGSSSLTFTRRRQHRHRASAR